MLNSIYNIYAVVLKRRIAEAPDDHIQKTQYGFRAKKSTTLAMQCVRRLAEAGEPTNSKTLLVLLDWEKAFDKISKEGLMSALARLNMPDKYLKVVGSLYNEPKFMVEMDGIMSKWKTQETGIRQGCPLSPYLFILVMTVIFEDIHDGDQQMNLVKHRVAGATFDEVLYADDTICASKDTRAMNKLLAQIETIGEKYGMKLNKTKCELLKFGGQANVHFKDGAKVPLMSEVGYLGVKLNDKCDNGKEFKNKIYNNMATLNKLDLFWSRSRCPANFKLYVYDAVIRAKVLYGLVTAELAESEMKSLDVFHLKGLRKDNNLH